YFFFQAEDGIRDFHVTGVQTCALPILKQPGSTINWSRWGTNDVLGTRSPKPSAWSTKELSARPISPRVGMPTTGVRLDSGKKCRRPPTWIGTCGKALLPGRPTGTTWFIITGIGSGTGVPGKPVITVPTK